MSLVHRQPPRPAALESAGPAPLIAALSAEPPEHPEPAGDPGAQVEIPVGSPPLQTGALYAAPELAAPPPQLMASARPEAETPRQADFPGPSRSLSAPPEPVGTSSGEHEIRTLNIETPALPPQETESIGAAQRLGGLSVPTMDVRAADIAEPTALEAKPGMPGPKLTPAPAEPDRPPQPEAADPTGDIAVAARSGTRPGELPEVAEPIVLITPTLDEDLGPSGEPIGPAPPGLSTPDPPSSELQDQAAAEGPIAAGEAGPSTVLEDPPGDLEQHVTDEEPAADASLGLAGAPRPPSRYRPKLRERAAATAPRAPVVQGSASAPQTSPGSLEADLVLVFQPGGWGIALSLLLRRSADLPEQVSVNVAGELLELAAIDDSLFEPTPIADPIAALCQGVSAQSLGAAPRRWVRSGRRLHVFTERPGVFGFASAPRVVIGQENIILCETALAGQILDLCQLTGSAPPQDVEGPGVPDGWRCLRGYRPRWPGAWDGDDIFLALSPLPDAAIGLVGGIAVSRSAWILGRPPAIRILGSEPAPGDVTIDLVPAVQEAGGQWTTPGWDTLGHHAVRFAGLLRRYEMVEVDGSWDWWPAHAGSSIALAGALASTGTGRPAIVVRDTGGWLLGAQPGEAARMSGAAALASAFGAPSFAPVWALPSKTKRRPSALLLDSPRPPQAPPPGARPEAITLWRQLIRDAASSPVGGGERAALLWQAYREAARLLKRRGR